MILLPYLLIPPFHHHQPSLLTLCQSSRLFALFCDPLGLTRANPWIWSYLLVSGRCTNGYTMGDNVCPLLEEFSRRGGVRRASSPAVVECYRPSLVKVQAGSYTAVSPQLRRLCHVPAHSDFIPLFSIDQVQIAQNEYPCEAL